MGWATQHIERLRAGETIRIRPKGNSMRGHIESGQLVEIAPIGEHVIAKRDIVLAKVNGRQFLHLVSAVKGDQVQISNAAGFVNGWTSKSNVYGLVIGRF